MLGIRCVAEQNYSVVKIVYKILISCILTTWWFMVYSHRLGPEPQPWQGPGPGRMGCMVLIRTFHTAPEQWHGTFSGPEEWVYVLKMFPEYLCSSLSLFLLKPYNPSGLSLRIFRHSYCVWVVQKSHSSTPRFTCPHLECMKYMNGSEAKP